MKRFFIRDYNEQTDLYDYEMKPKQAILAKCKECCGFSMKEAILCQCTQCPLHGVFKKFTKHSLIRQKMQDNTNNQEINSDENEAHK